jgi:hypothetical protein
MKRAAWLMLLAIILVGAALRVADLADIPPGLYHDEAYSGLDALALGRGAGLPIFFEGNGGREPFFIYLHALSLWLLGSSPFALRIPAAFVGIATIPVFFALVRALNAHRAESTGLAVIAAAGLATSYWHLNFSRLGWRTIALPLFACLAFYFLWRARRTRTWRDHLLAGLFLGAGLYTYLAARFLPLVVAAFWSLELFSGMLSRAKHRASQFVIGDVPRQCAWRTWARNAGLVIVTALIVFAPLAFYYVTHPRALFFRINDVTLATEGNPTQAVWSNTQRVLETFYQRGDPEWRHGIARRPLLDWVIGIPFALGLLAALVCWRQPETWFAFLWLGIMFLPTILSRDAPDTQRAIGALPAIYLFVAWGFGAIVDAVKPRSHAARGTRGEPSRASAPIADGGRLRVVVAAVSTTRRSLMLGAALLVLVAGGWITARDYFVAWASDKRAYYDFQGDYADLARWLNSQSANVLLPMELYAESTIHFLTLPRFPATRSVFDLDIVEWNQIAAERSAIVSLPARAGGAFALLRQREVILLNPTPGVEPTLRASADQEEWQDRWGKTLAMVASLPDQDLKSIVQPLPFTPLAADFDRRLNLVGYTLAERRIAPGKPYPVTLYWTSRAPMQENAQVFVHLLDAENKVIAGVDESFASGYHLSLLPQGIVIPDRHWLSTDPALPPGKYALEIGVYLPATDSRLPLWIDGARAPDDRVIIAPLKVSQAANATVTPDHMLDVRFENGIVLAGFNLGSGDVKRGAPLQMTLFWTTSQPIDRDYTIFVHLLDSNERIVAQKDHQPQNGIFPTSIWETGEQVCDQFTLAVPLEAPETLRIAVGLYDARTGQRAPVSGGAQDRVILDVSIGIRVQ